MPAELLLAMGPVILVPWEVGPTIHSAMFFIRTVILFDVGILMTNTYKIDFTWVFCSKLGGCNTFIVHKFGYVPKYLS